MDRMRIYMLFGLLIASVLALNAATAAQTAHPLEITISASRTSFHVGEDIELKIVFRNNSKRTIPISVSSGPQAEVSNKILVLRSSGGLVPKTEYGKLVAGEAEPGHASPYLNLGSYRIPLGPGKEIATGSMITKVFDMHEPGEYLVKVEHRLPPEYPKPAQSNSLSIQIEP
jgi:hypothetical protein